MLTLTRNPFGQWCSCGKPFEFKCRERMPDNYFTGMTNETARRIRQLYLSEIISSGISQEQIVCENRRAKISDSKYKIVMNYEDLGKYSTEVHQNNKKYVLLFPDESDPLSEDQLSKLNKNDWEGFKLTLPGYYLTDIIITLGDFLDRKWLCRAFLTETDADKPDKLEFIANGNCYIYNLEENEIRLIHRGADNSWADFNINIITINSLEITLPNNKKIRLDLNSTL